MATIHDVARQAGVGVGTISRVVNGHPRVSEKTREKVTTAIAELGYRTNRNARGLARGRMSTIAVLVPFITHASAMGRIRGVVDGCRRLGLPVSIFDVEVPEHQHEHLKALAGDLRPEGLVVVSLHLSDEELAWLRAAHVPTVLIDVDDEAASSLVVDDERGGRLATEHLLALGHRRIALIGDDESDAFGFTSTARRKAGYRAALADAGIAPGPALERLGPHGSEVACALTHDLLSQPEPPTAVFTTSDTQAFGAARALRELGLRIPHDVSLVGFDDIESAADAGLTTVRQPLFESGAMAARMLADLISVPDAPPERIVLDVELVIRSTTGPPP